MGVVTANYPGKTVELNLATTTFKVTLQFIDLGIPLLICIFAIIFAFLFYGGNHLSTIFSDLWATYMSPVIDGALFAVFGVLELCRFPDRQVDAQIRASWKSHNTACGRSWAGGAL